MQSPASAREEGTKPDRLSSLPTRRIPKWAIRARQVSWSLTYSGGRLAAALRGDYVRKAVLVLWWLGMVILIGFLFGG